MPDLVGSELPEQFSDRRQELHLLGCSYSWSHVQRNFLTEGCLSSSMQWMHWTRYSPDSYYSRVTGEVFRQKGVDDRVETAIDVGEAGGADLEGDHCHAVDVDAGVRLGEEGDVGGQPADGEGDDDGRHHPHDAASSGRRLDGRAEHLAGVRPDATAAADTSNQQDVEDTDDWM